MTRLTTASQPAYHPVYQGQGPDTNCVIYKNGIRYELGWDSCTAYAAGMSLDGTTHGTKRPSGCAIRRATGDVMGGLTLRQVSDAIIKLYGTPFMSTYTGANVLSPQRAAQLVRAGHKVVVQGNADAMIGTQFQSTAGAVNHAVAWIDSRGGTISEPAEDLIYDPAADGRKRAYHVDQGPSWWPHSLLKRFCANLRPAGDGTPRLGPGMVYAGVFPDSAPMVSLRKGAIKSKPFPDRVRAAKATVWIHSNLHKGAASHLYSVPKGTLLVGYQYGVGSTFEGEDHWLGNDLGTEWVHFANLDHVGGDT